jgi:hypothetical protein
MQAPFNLDKYEYQTGGYFDVFKRNADEKICAVMVCEAIAANLRNVGLVYNAAGTIAVVDIGCGPADIIQMYLAAARHSGSFSIHATDCSQDYTGADGMARANLAAAKRAGELRISDFSVTNGDAFDGRLNATLGTAPNHFPLVIISHLFYHTTPEHLGRMLADVANNVLTPEGVGILIHTANKPNSFQYFRSKYGRTSATAGASDTPAMDVDDPPRAVEQACQAAGIPFHTAHYTNNYFFAAMDETYWEIFKRPAQYRTIADKAALDNLRQLYFIPQRAANEFAADTGERGLSAYIDEVRKVIAPDQARFGKDGGVMALAEAVQLIGHAKASAQTRAKLFRVAEALEAELPRLEEQARQTWKTSRAVELGRSYPQR